ncbi:MAG: SIR2 family protein [Rhodobacterales bacterium]|nr:SIR2 family protein [Rhodobacterales bacterium]
MQRLRGARERGPRDICSLNYDTLLEASLDSLRLSYSDGFRGTNRAWFDPQTFEEAGPGISYRIHKLHGSINWTRDVDGHVRRGRNANEDAADEPVVVYPSEQKYLQTQYGVYETLISHFRNRLRRTGVNNHLVVLGYSFNDEHINEAICDAINSPQSNFTVIAFVGPEQDRDKQDQRLQAFCDRCDSRFSVFVGGKDNGGFIGHALDVEASLGVLEANLWKFENLVAYIAGEN